MDATFVDTFNPRTVSLLRESLVNLVQDFSIEVTPGAASKIADFRELLSPGRSVAVTFLPGSDFASTATTAKRLKQDGFRPMPHLCARAIKDARELEEHLKRLKGDAGAEDVVVLAGGLAAPIGTFDNSMQLLDTGLFEKYRFRSIGLAGHPEGNPDIADDMLAQALAWKNNYAATSAAACYLCTQFVFDAQPVIAWDKRLKAAGNRLPIHIGVPGLATLKTLISHATACGVGPSMRVLTRQAKNLTKLMTTRKPDKLLLDIAKYQADEESCGIRRVHVYPLGGFRKSAAWFRAVECAEVEVCADGEAFDATIQLD